MTAELSSASYSLEPIGIIHSPYKEKFAVPRQPRLVPAATAQIELLGEANCPESVRGIEQFSHLWLLFLFDQNLSAGWKPTVRPPRLGGNERVGVFASRSTFRPNGIGMSAVEFRGIRQEGKQTWLDVGSVDLVDGTPIIDIKPYLPYADCIEQASGGYAGSEPERSAVHFCDSARTTLAAHPQAHEIEAVITQVLAQDPRPAYKKDQPDNKEYAVNLFDLNVKFSVSQSIITVTAIERF
ncbi:tRNA (N6-threonylcarbamoyladenosine(37)-N6)-methyltransferase TrmO [Vibrio mangrovi]|uniref:Putative tRNA (Adenine(37)-N6)-methyltransferase n=1 Tax=Vibrio mangrovi TaxID=474394 RepID=A0A1Y6IQF0_9VIBR|nr:tRNA (N6-threonylcarbamoyladenosine(37)-N6)-methyltransferase TrmO [Vibrio mangrovi]MDW6003354.1 tRNA (N6-threonylcarbamoyladenosine(37)-N6)-methyltransferase TrmO [Vibrio mangrovi]SMR99856.1 putative tRNA (adenine(37)-N6)-methyltransferase [Vibrio mangrovi]